ncbi:glycosyltransferase family 4 protein [Aestuariivivens sediminis]|uniref:glycosyltransferase family 4 protein n=1 Tax=Aestuariivivens sediminis TaxID=2913557 RepID=UPI001F593607|nr:glycosyltransferase family 4 protein [Aestuariivivens sediminis]
MKIGLVLAKPPGYSETFFISKIKGLQNHGFRVTLFVQNKEADFNLCDVKVAPKVYNRNLIMLLGNGLIVFLKLFLKFNRSLKFFKLEKQYGRSNKQLLKNLYNNSHLLRANLDWVHFGFATFAIESEHVAKAIRAKMSVSFRGFDLDVYPLKHLGCYQLLWQQVDKAHSISNYLLQKAYTLGLPKDVPCQIIRPAVDLSLAVDKQIVKSKPLRFVTVARLHWIKGIQATLEALALLKAKHIDFKYQIIGDGPEYEALKFAIHQLELSEHVALVGKLSHQKNLKELAKADVYIQYSYSEGFCNAVLEAQAMGLLCVVSDGGGLPENVIHERTGWVVPKGRPKLLATCLESILQKPEGDLNTIRQRAKTRVLQDFNLNSQQHSFRNFYEVPNS